jgi:hypothetical protein
VQDMKAPTPDRGTDKRKGRPPREGLDPLQRHTIVALLSYPTQTAAAAAVGVSEKTIRRWFQQPCFRDEYFRQLDELLAEQWSMMTAVRNEIWERFIELTRSENEMVVLRAVTWYFDHLSRRMPSLQLRRRNDDDALEHPPRLRELYARLDDPSENDLDGDGR